MRGYIEDHIHDAHTHKRKRLEDADVSVVADDIVHAAPTEIRRNITGCRTLNFNWKRHKERVDTVKPSVRVENIVVTFHTLKITCNCKSSCKCGYDLDYLIKTVPNTHYDPKRFSAVIHRIDEANSKSTALIFQGGKVVVAGTKSEKDAKIASMKHVKMLQTTFPSMDIYLANFQIQNVVGNGETTFNISLEKFATDHPDECTYDPENFPGVIYRPKNIDITMLIFVSGKMVIPGGKSEKAIHDAFEKVLPMLRNYKKPEQTARLNLPKVAGKHERRDRMRGYGRVTKKKNK